jgi:amino acid adenylation domain-containing protein
MNSVHVDTFPTSFAQQRMWLLDRVLPAHGVYNAGDVIRIRGALDTGALERALDALVRRHESLRTFFPAVDGLPVQAIAAALPVRLQAERVSGQEDAWQRAYAEAQAGFDLERGPLWRTRLYSLGPEEHWFQWTLHHIITDGWSTGVFVRDMSQLYTAFAAGAVPTLPELPVQYADYAVWQRQWLQGDVLSRQIEYWRQALANLPVLDLPADRRRPLVSSYRGERIRFELPQSLTGQLKGFSRRENVTLFMTLLATFHVLLARYGGQGDVAVGVAVAGRARPELEGLIGFFVNTLVMRGDLSGAPSFREYLVRVRERVLDALAHQDVPFEKLVEELAPKRDLARNPLFQASFSMRNTPDAEWALPGLDVERIEGARSESAKFDVALSIYERAGALQCSFEYASDLFDAATAQRMVGSFRTLLEAVTETPHCSVARLPLMTAAERGRVLAQGVGPAIAAPAHCVHDLVAAQAARTPDGPAVVHGERQLTYAQLVGQAGQLAHHLRALGVGTDALVGLCLPRSLELVVAMLAILQAGGGYVPLDPEYPAARLQLMLEDADARVLVTRSDLLSNVPDFRAEVVCLDRDAKLLSGYPHSPPAPNTTPSNLAYAIYTSGSTGRPKGVLVEHRNVAALAYKSNYVEIGPGDVVGHASNVAFDAATFEIWGALTNGACIAVLEQEQVLTAPAIADAIARHRVTCMWLTTSLFNEIARSDPNAFGALRCLLAGGEAQDPKRVQEVLGARTPPGRLVNGYGPTETTTFATFHPMTRDDVDTIPIGRPLAGAELLVLDSANQVVPPLVVGELHIGGSGVARGYLNRPEETRQRFVPHPERPKEVVFRSGDLVRWNGQGNLEYLGRNDTQVKIRGFRIEPSEVAAVVASHPAVSACHVIVRGHESGYAVLVAYYVPNRGHEVATPAELARHAASRLPAYMVPASWVELDAFPLTANGKLDESALPEPSRAVERAAYTAPRDDTERALCRIWAEVLGVDQVGIDDDFFEIGGHSLLAARVFSRIDTTLRCALPLGTLFQCPTIRGLAPRILAASGVERMPSLVAVTRRSAEGPPIYLVPGGYGNIVGFADLARALGSTRSVYALQSPGLENIDYLSGTIEDIARQYVAEIRRVQPKGPYAFGGACFGATVAYEIARQVMQDGETVACLALLDPTSYEGIEADRKAASVPRPVRHAAALGRFARDRLKLYRGELQTLEPRERFAYVAGKLRVAAHRLAKPGAPDVRREINEREVYRAHVAALERYRRAPLDGDLRLLVIIETTRTRDHREQSDADWTRSWKGEVAHHVVAGTDSGDMISGSNATEVGVLLGRHLRDAFAAAKSQVRVSRSRQDS